MPEDVKVPPGDGAPPDIQVEVEPTPPPPAAPVDAAPIVEVAVDPVADKLATLEKEKKDLHERLLRTAADFDNFRKRTRKEMDEARAKAKEDVIREILPVVDNLERALLASGDGSAAAGAAIAEGVKLVLRQFTSALDRFEVKSFGSVGEAFDPARHEAISQIATADKPAGTVVTEMQKGYLMGTRLIRPAMVAVARPPDPPAKAEPENAESAKSAEIAEVEKKAEEKTDA